MYKLVLACSRRTGSVLGRYGSSSSFLKCPLRFFSASNSIDPPCARACNEMCGTCHKKNLCWNCHHFTDCQERFCPTCHKIQPVYSEEEGGCNYFQLFGIHESYDINPTELEANFKNLQKVIHPDLFSNKSAEEQAVSAKVSTTLNIAHNMLKNPITRAAYLVKLRTGKDVLGEDKNYKVPMEMLMEVMELRERLSESKSKEDKEKIHKEVLQSFKKHEDDFRCSLCKKDNEALCDEAVAMKYYDSIIKEFE